MALIRPTSKVKICYTKLEMSSFEPDVTKELLWNATMDSPYSLVWIDMRGIKIGRAYDRGRVYNQKGFYYVWQATHTGQQEMYQLAPQIPQESKGEALQLLMILDQYITILRRNHFNISTGQALMDWLRLVQRLLQGKQENQDCLEGLTPRLQLALNSWQLTLQLCLARYRKRVQLPLELKLKPQENGPRNSSNFPFYSNCREGNPIQENWQCSGLAQQWAGWNRTCTRCFLSK